MITHVIDNVLHSDAERFIVATDDQRIPDTVAEYPVEQCMSSEKHNSGSERMHDVTEKFDLFDDTATVNMQGNKPLMPGAWSIL